MKEIHRSWTRQYFNTKKSVAMVVIFVYSTFLHPTCFNQYFDIKLKWMIKWIKSELDGHKVNDIVEAWKYKSNVYTSVKKRLFQYYRIMFVLFIGTITSLYGKLSFHTFYQTLLTYTNVCSDLQIYHGILLVTQGRTKSSYSSSI